MVNQAASPVTAAAAPPGTTPAGPRALEALLYGRLGLGLARSAGEVVVGIAQACDALEIDAGPELERLAAARWAGLSEIIEPGSAESIAVLPWPAARLWLLGLDARRVAPRLKKWLEGLQADAVELLRDLPEG